MSIIGSFIELIEYQNQPQNITNWSRWIERVGRPKLIETNLTDTEIELLVNVTRPV